MLNMRQYKKKLWLVQGSSAYTKAGLKEGIEWNKENYRKCGICKVRVQMKLECECYICEECIYNKYSKELKKDKNNKFIFEEKNVCGCLQNYLTKKEFNIIFNNKKLVKVRRELETNLI